MAIPVVTVEEMRAWEASTWQQGVQEEDVIHQVGAAIAEWIRHSDYHQHPVVILAGKGHNGDDGKAAALHMTGADVQTISIQDPKAAIQVVQEALSQDSNLVIDCLFGIGLNRPLSNGWDLLVQVINDSPHPIISIDTPSGLDVREGIAPGPCIVADYTLTVGAPKLGMLSKAAQPFVGYIHCLTDVGLSTPPEGGELYFNEPRDFAHFPPRRRAGDHKGTHGHLQIIAGSAGFHGAAVLATRGAMAARTGLITLETLPECYLPVASQVQQAMVRSWFPENPTPRNTSAILIGPGLAASNVPASLREYTRTLWRSSPIPVIVDASALNWIPAGPATCQAPRIITPHPGEAARMLFTTTKTIQQRREETVRRLAEKFANCWVVLKGTHSLIGNSTSNLYFNNTGNPNLAQGGSGDVLAGILAGLLAQPRCQVELERTIRFAVWQHGRAADELQRNRAHWTIEDLPEGVRL